MRNARLKSNNRQSGQGLRRRAVSEAGFTVVELLVYLVIGVVIVGSIYQLFIGQNRMYTKQRELMDVRSSLRAATALLAWELRQASASEGDIYTIGTNSVALRSPQAMGVICGEHGTLLRYGLWGSSGEFSSTADDSAQVFAAGGAGSDDDQWKVVKVDKIWDPNGGGIPRCSLGDTVVGPGAGTAAKGKGTKGGCDPAAGCKEIPADLVVEISGDVEAVYLGAGFRAFRRVEYALFQEDGRWWLGRKVGAAASFEKLTGPLRQPADSGLVFVYYDAAGDTTSIPGNVAMVKLIVRGESFGKVRQARKGKGPGVNVQQDTLTTWVSLRG